MQIKPINCQLLALRCGQRSLVGNGFIRSACHGFVGTHRSGYRNKCIGNYSLLIINYSSFIIHWGGHRPPLFCLPLAELEGKMPLAADEVLFKFLPSGKNIMKSGRAMLAPTTIDFSTGKVATGGTDKSGPYKGASQNSAAHYRVAWQLRLPPTSRTELPQ